MKQAVFSVCFIYSEIFVILFEGGRIERTVFDESLYFSHVFSLFSGR